MVAEFCAHCSELVLAAPLGQMGRGLLDISVAGHDEPVDAGHFQGGFADVPFVVSEGLKALEGQIVEHGHRSAARQGFVFDQGVVRLDGGRPRVVDPERGTDCAAWGRERDETVTFHLLGVYTFPRVLVFQALGCLEPKGVPVSAGLLEGVEERPKARFTVQGAPCREFSRPGNDFAHGFLGIPDFPDFLEEVVAGFVEPQDFGEVVFGVLVFPEGAEGLAHFLGGFPAVCGEVAD